MEWNDFGHPELWFAIKFRDLKRVESALNQYVNHSPDLCWLLFNGSYSMADIEKDRFWVCEGKWNAESLCLSKC
jgi:hypothetical protein